MGFAEAAKALNEFGFCILPHVITLAALDELTKAVEALSLDQTTARVAGTRNLAALVPAVARFADSPKITTLLEGLGFPGGFLVRSILFDKQPSANWKVAWHQDLTISVSKKRHVPGFGPWTEKAGVQHVQSPASILERMLTLRLHLDDCDADNGALKVIPGSHRDGILTPSDIQRWRQNTEAVCTAPAGSILAMRPLLLHASSQAVRPKHRRVVHLEYAMDGLPGGLEWCARGLATL